MAITRARLVGSRMPARSSVIRWRPSIRVPRCRRGAGRVGRLRPRRRNRRDRTNRL